MTHSFASQPTALDQLVALQLDAIIHRETRLRERYSDLLASSTLDEMQAWKWEMQQLQTQTDRLARMLGALDGSYTMPLTAEKNTQSAA
jgi:hypothetical protein